MNDLEVSRHLVDNEWRRYLASSLVAHPERRVILGGGSFLGRWTPWAFAAVALLAVAWSLVGGWWL